MKLSDLIPQLIAKTPKEIEKIDEDEREITKWRNDPSRRAIVTLAKYNRPMRSRELADETGVGLPMLHSYLSRFKKIGYVHHQKLMYEVTPQGRDYIANRR